MDEQTRLAEDGLLTIAEVCEFLKFGRNTIYNAMARGELQYVQKGRSRRIPKRAAIEWAAADMQGGWACQSHRVHEDASQTPNTIRLAESYCKSTARIQGS